MYRLTASDMIERIADGAMIPPDPENRDRAAYDAWVEDGGVPEPVPEPVLTLADYGRAVDAHIEAVARTKGYSSAISAVSYADDPNPIWKAEGVAFRAWRSASWVVVYAKLALVQGGAHPPSIAALVASLPTMEWPA